MTDIKAGDKVRTANGATAVVSFTYFGQSGVQWAEIKFPSGRKRSPWRYGYVLVSELEYLGPAEPEPIDRKG